MLTLRLALPLIIAENRLDEHGHRGYHHGGAAARRAVAIGATGLGQSLYHSIAIFGGGLLLGLDTFVSQAYGRKDLNDARLSLVNGVFSRSRSDPHPHAHRPVLAFPDAALRNQRRAGGTDASRSFARSIGAHCRCWPTSPFAAICRQ